MIISIDGTGPRNADKLEEAARFFAAQLMHARTVQKLEIDLQFDGVNDRPHWIKFRVMVDDTIDTIEQYVENIFTAGNFVDYESDW